MLTTTEESRRDTLLTRALAANAAFSGLSGLVLLAAAGPVAGWIGLEGGAWLRAIGAGLLLFAAALVGLTRSREPARRAVGAVTAADLAWVAGSALLLALFPDLLTTAGERTVGAVAVVVAALAAAQLLGLRRRVARSRDDGPRPGASGSVSEEASGPGGRPSP